MRGKIILLIFIFALIYIFISKNATACFSVKAPQVFLQKKMRNESKTNRKCSVTYGCLGGVIRNSMVASRNYTKE